MVLEQVRHTKTCELPIEALHSLAPDISWKAAPTISPDLLPTEVCQVVGNWYVESSSEARRYQAGQFFTPAIVARFMANLAGMLHEQTYILDAGAGVGILACALIELAKLQNVSPLTIVVYESDPVLYTLCSFTLDYARSFLQKHHLDVTLEIHQQDFLEAMASQFTSPSLWSSDLRPEHPLDLAILNPPYFKVNQADRRAKIVKDIAFGRTNMYTMFMSLAASSLRIGGKFISITPRSFASGAYFKQFRQQFFNLISPEHIHLFDSRRSTFEDADVLQENIILAGVKKGVAVEDAPTVAISRSKGIGDLGYPLVQRVARQLILDEKQKDPVLHLPTSDIDTHLLQVFRGWENRLSTYGLEISTGPVVPFRADNLLTSHKKVEAGEAVPLLWLQHVRRMSIQWPLEHFDKPQGISVHADQKLLVRNETQIILRRFSAKEEERRITAAVLFAQSFPTPLIGLENHLNYLYRSSGILSNEEAVGITAFLNSSLVDRYFRIANGNTQVNATELRSLPLPPLEMLLSIGRQVIYLHAEQNFDLTEQIVMETLEKDLIVGDEHDLQLPLLKDSRIVMGKIQEAQRILQELGMPPAQQNEISALTLLALCNLSETDSWDRITNQTITIHNMMGFMKQHYGRAYAENTREVVRRQVIHQFEQARLVDRNPDDPMRETNSPNYCYALTSEALNLLRQFGMSSWEAELTNFLEQHGALWEQYQRKRQSIALPLKLADGSQVYLTPGKHNKLQIAIVETFGSHFAPGATLLYLGDTANKLEIFESERLKELGVPITAHDKLPDILLYLEKKNWLYLIEAVTSHGPVSHKRRHELENLLKGCKAKRIYISAFHDFAEFGRHRTQIAWETEVWIAEAPEHMIHYNGERFFGGYE